MPFIDATMAPILRAQDRNAHAFLRSTTMAPVPRAQKPNAKPDPAPEFGEKEYR